MAWSRLDQSRLKGKGYVKGEESGVVRLCLMVRQPASYVLLLTEFLLDAGLKRLVQYVPLYIY